MKPDDVNVNIGLDAKALQDALAAISGAASRSWEGLRSRLGSFGGSSGGSGGGGSGGWGADISRTVAQFSASLKDAANSLKGLAPAAQQTAKGFGQIGKNLFTIFRSSAFGRSLGFSPSTPGGVKDGDASAASFARTLGRFMASRSLMGVVNLGFEQAKNPLNDNYRVESAQKATNSAVNTLATTGSPLAAAISGVTSLLMSGIQRRNDLHVGEWNFKSTSQDTRRDFELNKSDWSFNQLLGMYSRGERQQMRKARADRIRGLVTDASKADEIGYWSDKAQGDGAAYAKSKGWTVEGETQGHEANQALQSVRDRRKEPKQKDERRKSHALANDTDAKTAPVAVEPPKVSDKAESAKPDEKPPMPPQSNELPKDSWTKEQLDEWKKKHPQPSRSLAVEVTDGKSAANGELGTSGVSKPVAAFQGEVGKVTEGLSALTNSLTKASGEIGKDAGGAGGVTGKQDGKGGTPPTLSVPVTPPRDPNSWEEVKKRMERSYDAIDHQIREIFGTHNILAQNGTALDNRALNGVGGESLYWSNKMGRYELVPKGSLDENGEKKSDGGKAGKDKEKTVRAGQIDHERLLKQTKGAKEDEGEALAKRRQYENSVQQLEKAKGLQVSTDGNPQYWGEWKKKLVGQRMADEKGDFLKEHNVNERTFMMDSDEQKLFSQFIMDKWNPRHKKDGKSLDPTGEGQYLMEVAKELNGGKAKGFTVEQLRNHVKSGKASAAAQGLLAYHDSIGSLSSREQDKNIVSAVKDGSFKSIDMASLHEALQAAVRQDIDPNKDANFKKVQALYHQQERRAEGLDFENFKEKYDISQVTAAYTDGSRVNDAMSRQGFFVGSTVDVQDVNKDILAEVRKIVPILREQSRKGVDTTDVGFLVDTAFK